MAIINPNTLVQMLQHNSAHKKLDDSPVIQAAGHHKIHGYGVEKLINRTKGE